MVFVQVLIAILGVILFAVGVLQARVWRLSRVEPRFVQVGVGVLASSRLVAGLALFAAAAAAVWQLFLVGAICVLAGNVAASTARRQLKRL